MRVLFAFALAGAAVVGACSAFGADAPAAPAPGDNDGGTTEPVPPPSLDAATAPPPFPGCAALDPAPKTCFDFDPATPPPSGAVKDHVSLTTSGDAGNHWLEVTIQGGLASGDQAQGYYPIGIDGAPPNVRWSYDVRLDTAAETGVEIVAFPTASGNDKCILQTKLSQRSVALFELCGADDPMVLSTAIPIDGGWWNFAFDVDFTQKTASLVVSNNKGAMPPVSGKLTRAIAATPMSLEFGLSFANSSEDNAVVALDNLIVDY